MRLLARLAVDAAAALDPEWSARAPWRLKAEDHPREFVEYVLAHR
jgi:hypothetical protein